MVLEDTYIEWTKLLRSLEMNRWKEKERNIGEREKGREKGGGREREREKAGKKKEEVAGGGLLTG